MRPNAFQYSRPNSLCAALDAMADGAVPLAGGQTLIQALRLRTLEPSRIVDINAIADLSDGLAFDTQTLQIGALTTHRTLLEDSTVRREFPWLAKAASDLGDVQIRNRGTVLGNVCWADPRANMAVALLASDAQVSLASHTETEQVPIERIFSGFRENSIGARLATSISIPRRANAVGCYVEFSRQRQDLALVNVCVVKADRRFAVAIGGIDASPRRIPSIEQVLNENSSSILASDQILTMLAALPLQPVADHFGDAAYKHQLAATLLVKALSDCNAGGNRDQ